MPRSDQGTGLFPELRPHAERDALIDAAISAGKFPEARRAHYEALYDQDPERTRGLLARLEPAPAALRAQTAKRRGTGLFPELDRPTGRE